MDRELNPFATTGDDGKYRRPRIRDPHIVLQLRHMLLGRRFFRKRPWQHELGFEYGTARINAAIQSRRHPFIDRVADVPLYVLYGVPGIALVPAPIEVFCHRTEL